ncbi:hypothetical protein [Streptomyces sp. ERV7]|nr:hypothetical protein [Streptomyces sp. ERV7]
MAHDAVRGNRLAAPARSATQETKVAHQAWPCDHSSPGTSAL